MLCCVSADTWEQRWWLPSFCPGEEPSSASCNTGLVLSPFTASAHPAPISCPAVSQLLTCHAKHAPFLEHFLGEDLFVIVFFFHTFLLSSGEQLPSPGLGVIPVQGSACASSSQPSPLPCLNTLQHVACWDPEVLTQKIQLPGKPFASHITLTSSKLPRNGPYSTFMPSTGKLFVVFHPLVD